MMRLLFLAGGMLLSACTVTTNAPESVSDSALPTAYDYSLKDGDLQPIRLADLVRHVSDSDVVFVGEYHGNHASHLLESRLLTVLHQANKRHQRSMLLSMEMFTRDQQGIVDDYLEGKFGEHYLINEAPAWSNYKAGYRPLVEFVKARNIPIVAANAPGDIIRCIGRKGDSYINKLTSMEKNHIAQKPFAAVPGYQEKFMSFMGASGHSPSERHQNTYLAQLARDNTMAESIAKALEQRPGSQVLHINGSFHSEGHMGTAGALKRMKPSLKIMVVTPLYPETLSEMMSEKVSPKETTEFFYVLNPEPHQFVNDEYREAAMAKMFGASDRKATSCL